MTRLVCVLFSATLLLAMAGCASPSDQATPSSPATATTTPTTTTTTISTTPTASPSSLPTPITLTAADGTNLAACADGKCEVRVSGGAAIPLPKSTGARLAVESVGDALARLTITPTPVYFSINCDPVDACKSSSTEATPGQNLVTNAPASATIMFNTVTSHKVVVAVVAVDGDSAVLRISPA